MSDNSLFTFSFLDIKLETITFVIPVSRVGGQAANTWLIAIISVGTMD